MLRRRSFLKASLLAGGASCFHICGKAADCSRVGEKWGKWQPGQFQVHFIYTGVAESMFFIFPDGTSLLLDCGDHPACKRGRLAVPILPDQSRHAGEWIARYVQRVNPSGSNVDYMLVSHFHCDHTGDDRWHAGLTKGRGEDYYLSGLAQVAEFLKFGIGIDRGWPNYDDPVPHQSRELTNMRKLYSWLQKRDGLKMEKFRVGATDQLKLLKNLGPWQKKFSVRNICGNGKIALPNGKIQNLYEAYRKENRDENGMSLGSIFSYGKFRFYTAGDFGGWTPSVDGKPRIRIEEELAKVCGPCHVSKVNHHGHHSMPIKLIAALRSKVYVSCIWDQLHNLDYVMARLSDRSIYPDDRLLCPGVMTKERRQKEHDRPWMRDVARPSYDGGHIVLNVEPDGENYSITYLTAQDESMSITGQYYFKA